MTFPALLCFLPPRLFLITLSAALAYMNWRGLTLVGGLAVAFTVIIIVPFVLLIIIGAPRVDPRNWLKVRGGTGALLRFTSFAARRIHIKYQSYRHHC